MIGHKMVALRCAGASAESCWNRSTAQKWISLASFDSAPVGSCRHLLESLGAITGRVWVGWPWQGAKGARGAVAKQFRHVSCVCGVYVSARFRRFLEVAPIVWSFFRSFDLALVSWLLYSDYSGRCSCRPWFMCSFFLFLIEDKSGVWSLMQFPLDARAHTHTHTLHHPTIHL